MARLIGEFEASKDRRKNTDSRHHEQTKYAHTSFTRDVKAPADAMKEMNNPFCDNSNVDILVLDAIDLAE